MKKGFRFFYILSFAWQFGFLVVLPIGGFLFLGIILDKKLNSHPFFLILGIIVGIAITSYETYNNLKILLKKDKKNDIN